MLEENERIDDLELKNLKIIQNTKGFCFGMDSILLSDFAKKIKKNSIIVDLGTGTGILPILLSAKTESKKIYGIEIQEKVANMAKRSVKLNKLQDIIEIINIDIKNIFSLMEKNSIDVIVTNPPYKKKETGGVNDNEYKLISRHEITAELVDFIRISSELLKSNGEIYMVHRPERLADIITLMRKYKLEPKRIKYVYSNKKLNAKLVLIKAVKCAKPYLEVEQPLIIYNDDRTYTRQILEIYNK